jgi:RNA polymerase sigma-70 factor (ECF subfamily)
MNALNGVPPPTPAGDDYFAAVEALYRQHDEGLLRQARKYTGCTEAAEEVVHDVFLHLVERPVPLVALTPAYLFQAVHNKVLDHVRRAKSAWRYVETLSADEHCLVAPLVDEAEIRMLADELGRAIEALPPRYRQAFMLSIVEGLSYAHAGELMEISENTVRQLVRRARCQLRQALAEYATEMPPKRRSQAGFGGPSRGE